MSWGLMILPDVVDEKFLPGVVPRIVVGFY
jgi:hypothetical protein